jgi:hypothetical protein
VAAAGADTLAIFHYGAKDRHHRTNRRVGLFLPELINRGLMARDKLKYYVSLLQAAHVYAQSPHHPAPTLRGEREASGSPTPPWI